SRVIVVDRITITVLVGVLTEIRIAADEDPDLRVIVTCPDAQQTGVAVVSVSDRPPIEKWQARLSGASDNLPERIESSSGGKLLPHVPDRLCDRERVEIWKLVIPTQQ